MFRGRKFRVIIGFIMTIALGANLVQAEEVDRGQASAVAAKVVAKQFPLGSISTSVASNLKAGLPFFVVKVEPMGFVLVAKDDKCPPVLGYSWESNFPENPETAPEIFTTLIAGLTRQCQSYQNMDETRDEIREAWVNGSSVLKTGEKGLIAPLLTTHWSADSSYFDLYPGTFRTGGSVPIAMAQVYRYYGFPFVGNGEIKYLLNGVGDFQMKFQDYRFNFSRMAANEGNPAVDTLVFCMAVACRLQPAGAGLESFSQTLIEYYQYSPDMRRVEIWEYDLKPILLHQLSIRRPVLADWVGKAFVIDGYGGSELFHFNLGMGGTLDGFYLIDFPVVDIGSEHNLLNIYVNYHPIFLDWPVPSNVAIASTQGGVQISWTLNAGEEMQQLFSRFLVLRDGLFPIAETQQNTIVIDSVTMGTSSNIRVVAVYGANGASGLSEPVLYLTDQTPSDIPSIPLRQMINTKNGYKTDLVRQPFKGELELIRDLEIDFSDQRGIEKLPQLRNLRVDGSGMNELKTGDYQGRLTHFRFFKCSAFDYTTVADTRNLIQLYGYDYMPFDLYDFRHNSKVTFVNLRNTLPYLNALMDLYGVDKYFPKISEFYLNTWTAGIDGAPTTCFISVESYKEFVPKIRANADLLLHTQPAVFAPCYPVPARESNNPGISQLSWYANPANVDGVYYNVYVGPRRNSMEIVSVFQSEKSFTGTFEPNKDYYWRVEAFHGDTVYYSGINHFSTYTGISFPFNENFDRFYHGCPVTEEITFWTNTDNSLTGKAVTSNAAIHSGFYSMELKPKSDATVIFPQLSDTVINIDFRIRNEYGELGIEILQKATSGDVPVVNARIGLLGQTFGSFTHTGTPQNYLVTAGEWNHVMVEIHLNSGMAFFKLNDVTIAEWNWFIQMNGTANTGTFNGVRFVNAVGTGGGSSYIDDIKISNLNTTGIPEISLPSRIVVYNALANELIISGLNPDEFTRIELYTLEGRLVTAKELAGSSRVQLGIQPDNGLYLVVLSRRNGNPVTQKIAMFR